MCYHVKIFEWNGPHHFLLPGAHNVYVDYIINKKLVDIHFQEDLFSIFVIFLFDGSTLGHVFGHVGTCLVVTHQMKMKALGTLICLGTKILKIGPELREL